MWLHLKSMVRYTRKHLLPSLPGLSIRTESYPVWQKIHAIPQNSKDMI